jgi:hypothetical protein
MKMMRMIMMNDKDDNDEDDNDNDDDDDVGSIRLSWWESAGNVISLIGLGTTLNQSTYRKNKSRGHIDSWLPILC